MKQIIKKFGEYKIFLLMIFIIGGVFYWYEVRPIKIRSYCSKDAVERTGEKKVPFSEGIKIYDHLYERCLNERGIDR